MLKSKLYQAKRVLTAISLITWPFLIGLLALAKNGFNLMVAPIIPVGVTYYLLAVIAGAWGLIYLSYYKYSDLVLLFLYLLIGVAAAS